MLFLHNITKAFPDKVILENASLEIFEKEKVALIGANGLGKTSLVKMILGEDKDFGGTITLSSKKTLQTVAQDLPKSDIFLLDYILENFPQRQQMINLRALEKEMHNRPEDQSVLDRYSRELNLFEKSGGYDYVYHVKKVLEGLGFLESEFERPLSSFSGGEKRRALLAYLLITEPDILLLDEPTNHLDIKNTVFLENFIKNYPKAVILISHDREFIDNTSSAIVEIENKKLIKYKGNLSAFRKQKTERQEAAKRELKILKEEEKKLFDFISRFKAGTRSTQAASREKKLEEVRSQMDAIEIINTTAHIHFNERERQKPYDPPLKVIKVAKGFQGKELFSDVSFTMGVYDKAALIGINGSGKSTLLNIIAGELSPDRGEVKWNQNISLGYFTQQDRPFLENVSCYDYLLKEFGSRYQDTEYKSYLSNFRLQFHTPLSKLSGGEKSKLHLLSLLLAEHNFLILDEPTNHLDIYSIDGLLEIVKNFNGNILLVTHDRRFLKELNPEIYFLYGGKLERLINKDYQAIFEKLHVYQFDKHEKKEKNAPVRKKPGKVLKELQKLEDKIEALEGEIARLDNLKFDPAYYSSDEKFKDLEANITKLKGDLDETFLNWEQLQNEA